MAALDSSCGSPGCLKSIRSFLGNYQNIQYQPQCEQSLQLHEGDNVHSSLSKYIGYYTQQMPTPHQHSFIWNNFNINHQCGSAPITSVTYTQPGNSGYLQTKYLALQKPCSNAIYRTSHSDANASDWSRNYGAHKHTVPTNYMANNRQQKQQRQLSVEYLPEGKHYYIKPDHRINHREPAPNFSNGTRGSSRANSHVNEASFSVNYCKANRLLDDEEFSGKSTPVFPNMMHDYHNSRHSASNNHCSSGCCVPGTSCNLVNNNKFRMLKPANMISGPESFHKFHSERCCESISFIEKKTVSFEEDMEAKIPPPQHFSEQCNDEPLILTENYRPISPPAEYAGEPLPYHNAKVRYNFSRSYSQSQEKTKSTATINNINNHKSLPDLHSQTNRYSPHSEVLSCCSRGNRSAKSTGESSVNRDSGGSSGHYTHRSEPCYRQHLDRDREANGRTFKCYATSNKVEYRRDSGSSTQHSNTSYCDYVCKNSVDNYNSNDYLLNFPPLVVPEAFQDNYIPPPNLSRYHNYDNHYKYIPSQCQSSADTYDSMKNENGPTIVQLSDSMPLVEDLSPPPMEFKRQRCIRFKNHNRISFPTSDINESSTASHHKSDIQLYFLQRCLSNGEYMTATQPNIKNHNKTDQNNHGNIRNNALEASTEPTATPLTQEPSVDVERFFDRLGLKEEEFYEIYATNKRHHATDTDSEDSTIFFSEVSTVDSMRLPDSTETQTKANMSYRATAPLSIVERNARIIKWLCNMLKAQGELP